MQAVDERRRRHVEGERHRAPSSRQPRHQLVDGRAACSRAPDRAGSRRARGTRPRRPAPGRRRSRAPVRRSAAGPPASSSTRSAYSAITQGVCVMTTHRPAGALERAQQLEHAALLAASRGRSSARRARAPRAAARARPRPPGAGARPCRAGTGPHRAPSRPTAASASSTRRATSAAGRPEVPRPEGHLVRRRVAAKSWWSGSWNTYPTRCAISSSGRPATSRPSSSTRAGGRHGGARSGAWRASSCRSRCGR